MIASPPLFLEHAREKPYQMGKFTLLASMMLLIASGYYAVDTVKFIQKSVEVEAVVKSLKEEKDNNGSRYRPTLEFKTQSGEVVIQESDYSSRPAVGEVGDSVTIRYAEQNPKEYRIVGLYSMWGASVMTGSMALMAFICYQMISFAQRKF